MHNNNNNKAVIQKRITINKQKNRNVMITIIFLSKNTGFSIVKKNISCNNSN